MIEVHPISANIDSDLGSLADALDLVLVERDSTAPLTPTAQSWRTLDRGDLIRVRLGLADLGYDDYGTFRVDDCSIDASERQVRQHVHARDQAALLIEEQGEETFGYRSYGAQATEATNPSAIHVATDLAARVNLRLIWDASNYGLKQFVVNADESVSAAIARLLEPLQQSRRYRADAWVDGENLVVRRRGNGASAGTIDCSQGMTTVSRARQPQVGDIDVYGATYTYLTVYSSAEKVLSTGTTQDGGEPTASMRIVEQSPNHRVTETSTKPEAPNVSSIWQAVSRTTEDLTYEDVNEGGAWQGRILRKTRIEEQTNLRSEQPTRKITTTTLGYDDQWRLVLRDEQTWQRDPTNGDEPSIFVAHTITSYDQISPTNVRATTQKVGKPDSEGQAKVLSTDRQDAPGTLQSALQVNPALAPEGQWQTNPDGSQPEQVKGQEYTSQYHAQADGLGTFPKVYRNENLLGSRTAFPVFTIGQQIADDLAAESGKWLYSVSLRWPRPFAYRKGQKVTLTDLPGGCPDLDDALIVALRTRFDVEAAEWMHEVQVECWRDA